MQGNRGFSLVELLLAMTITVGIAAITFQLFVQNSRVFRDQDAIIDAQQAARATVFDIAAEIRMAGQGVPVFSATYDAGPTEGVGVVLAGSGSSRINLRTNRSGVETIVTGPLPPLRIGETATLAVSDAAVFSNAVGATPTGKFAYVWGPVNGAWGWARVRLVSISAMARAIQFTPVESGDGAASLQFVGAPTIALEEAVTIYHDIATRSIRRATATDMTNPAAPVWAPANEMAARVNSFSLTYFDRTGNLAPPDTVEHRAVISRVDFEISVETEYALSSGRQPIYRFSAQVIPRNLRIGGEF